MTYLITARFLKEFPGPFDIRPSRDGVDDTFDIYCLSTDRRMAATYYWEEEHARYIEAMGVTAALNFLFHEKLVLEEGRQALVQLLSQSPGPYSLKRGSCEYRGGFWEVVSKPAEESVLQCYGGYLDYSLLAVSVMVRHALTHADRFFPRERGIPSCPESKRIRF